MGWEPQPSWLAAHYFLAQAYVAQRETVMARPALDELLGLWKDADPELPLLRDARKLRREL